MFVMALVLVVSNELSNFMLASPLERSNHVQPPHLLDHVGARCRARPLGI